MKQTILVLFTAFAISGSSFITSSDPLKLYPKIETYFNSLDVSKKQVNNTDILSTLENNIELSEVDYRHTYLISSDNSDAAAFAHIILYSWLKARNFKKPNLLSCSNTQVISEQGIQTLKEIGYGVEYKDGTYQISFSDEIKPLTLRLFACTDRKANQTVTMKVSLGSSNGDGEKSSSSFYYLSGDSKQIFNSIATDLYSVIQTIKK